MVQNQLQAQLCKGCIRKGEEWCGKEVVGEIEVERVSLNVAPMPRFVRRKDEETYRIYWTIWEELSARGSKCPAGYGLIVAHAREKPGRRYLTKVRNSLWKSKPVPDDSRTGKMKYWLPTGGEKWQLEVVDDRCDDTKDGGWRQMKRMGSEQHAGCFHCELWSRD